MNIDKLRRYARPGDIILTGSNSLLSRAICYGQKVQTKDGRPSLWSHVMIYVNNDCVAESTMDFKPFPATAVTGRKRLDNGPQYNWIDNHKDVPRAMLLSFAFAQNRRADIIREADKIIKERRLYPVAGLIGSLLTFWVFRGWKSNPLNGRGLYCSAFVQECYRVVGIDFDTERTSRNTSPEMIWQYDEPGLLKIDVSE